MTATQWIYGWTKGSADGNASMQDLLGGKGANLAEMASLGIPVPPGFTITTEACVYYSANNNQFPDGLREQVVASLTAMETALGKRLGDKTNPLLVSVRSGARASMPGMMDTVLNLGLNDTTVQALATVGDPRFALDSYRRFIQMYSDVVLGVSHDLFEEILETHKNKNDAVDDTEITPALWKKIITDYKRLVEEETGTPFPADPQEQLWKAIAAVFDSWMNERAQFYRSLHNIPSDWGTAVNIQAMVFGNMGDDCATGVCFSRNPSTGDNRFYGEYLINAQGEDVVAGIRTPHPLTLAERKEQNSSLPSMEETMHTVFRTLEDVRARLEAHYKDMQDMEFTVERGVLWMLQTRSAKRSVRAAIKVALDMVDEGIINPEEAIMQIDPAQLDQLLHPTIAPNAPRNIITTGLPASPGATWGKIVFSAGDAELWQEKGERVILVRMETSPEDISGMHVSEGILTARGGMTSHAAVVARGMGRPCVSGAGAIHIDYAKKTLHIADEAYAEGTIISIDGSSGDVMLGKTEMITPELSGDFARLMAYADDCRTLGVRANAETPTDVQTAHEMGAEGIGLSRTEHMFFDPERIVHMRRMILAQDDVARNAALEALLPYQREDFMALFRIMDGRAVTIRLLDPPLHEFIPHEEMEMQRVADAAGVSLDALKEQARTLKEVNPMLGHRGCRLGITWPAIYEMQIRAILEAAIAVRADGVQGIPEIMIPLVINGAEFNFFKDMVARIAEEVIGKMELEPFWLVGTMIELPRAALRAKEIAATAEFFSFGTNDLTQTTFGLSRDDASGFLDDYYKARLLDNDPFQTLDEEGVGELIQIAVERGRIARPGIKMGICGEHGGDPASIDFCQRIGLDYVSCSPYRVPIARLAAAQSAVRARARK